jgi:hypothetical protein
MSSIVTNISKYRDEPYNHHTMIYLIEMGPDKYFKASMAMSMGTHCDCTNATKQSVKYSRERLKELVGKTIVSIEVTREKIHLTNEEDDSPGLYIEIFFQADPYPLILFLPVMEDEYAGPMLDCKLEYNMELQGVALCGKKEISLM